MFTRFVDTITDLHHTARAAGFVLWGGAAILFNIPVGLGISFIENTCRLRRV